jgi:hypothetical protein
MEISKPKQAWVESSIRLSYAEAIELSTELHLLHGKAPLLQELCQGILGEVYDIPQSIAKTSTPARETPKEIELEPTKHRYGKRGKYICKNSLKSARDYVERLDELSKKGYVTPSQLWQMRNIPNREGKRVLDYMARKGELIRVQGNGKKRKRYRYYRPGTLPVKNKAHESEPSFPLKPPMPKEIREKEYLCTPNTSSFEAFKAKFRSEPSRSEPSKVDYSSMSHKTGDFLYGEALKIASNIEQHPLSCESAKAYYTSLLEDIRIKFRTAFPHSHLGEKFYTDVMDQALMSYLVPMLCDKILDQEAYSRACRRMTPKDLAILIANAFSVPLRIVKDETDMWTPA